MLTVSAHAKMTKQTKNIIKWTGLTIVFGLILWIAYDFHFKFVINDYQARQIEKRLQDNFHDNRDRFNDLLTFSKQLSRLESVEFGENRQVSFQVYDTLLDRTTLENNFITIGDNSTVEVSDIDFIDSNSIKVKSGDETFLFNNWIVDYEGELDSPIVKKILAYNNISIDQLKQLNQKLGNINCNGFHKTDSLITIRFVGHWGESFNYLFPLTKKPNNEYWNKLTANYYWEHYQNGLFCGWTDW